MALDVKHHDRTSKTTLPYNAITLIVTTEEILHYEVLDLLTRKPCETKTSLCNDFPSNWEQISEACCFVLDPVRRSP